MGSDDLIGLSLVVPIFNGAPFLEDNLSKAWAWLREHEPDSELIIIDDGSSDDTAAIIGRFQQEVDSDRILMLRNEANRGKGFSIRKAMLQARGRYRVFTDADLTYPIENVASILEKLRDGTDVAIACRVHEDSHYIVDGALLARLATRHVMGRIFNVVARALVVNGLRDTQAGLKGFSAAAADQIFALQRLGRFSFDVEVLFIAQKLGFEVAEVGVSFIYCKEPSTIRFGLDTLKMLRDMLYIRLNSIWGRYRKRDPSPEG